MNLFIFTFLSGTEIKKARAERERMNRNDSQKHKHKRISLLFT